MQVCRYGRASGRVQGVGFRAYVQKLAQAEGLTGFAHNLPDGDVEVLLCGDMQTVAKAEALVAQGPALARVTKMEWENRACRAPDKFTTGWNEEP